MNTKLVFTLVFATSLAACGGGDRTDPHLPVQGAATAVTPAHLAYVDPTSSGWRLVKDASSTDTRLVLNLVGPAGTQTRGVGFNLKRGLGLAFAAFPNGAWAHDTGVYQLKGTNTNWESFAGSEADPVLFVSAPLKSGDVLSTGIFQKDRTNAAKDSSVPLVQVAVTLADFAKISASALAASSDPYGLHVIKARILPADIGGMDFALSVDVIKKAKMIDIAVDAGAITATP